MAVNVDRLLVLDTLKHGIDDDEAACPANTRAAGGGKEKSEKV